VCAPDAATPPPPPQTPAPPPAPTPVQRCITFLSQPTRKRKRYEELGNAQQYERKLLARTCLKVLDVKAAQLAERSISPGAIMLVPHATRARMRQVRGCRLPCETLIIRRRVSMATTHGTHTSTFDRGAYLTDPLTFVDKISGSSPLLVVGGDAGGGHTKLGITFINSSGNQTFAALLVYEGSDHYAELARLRAPGLTAFSGQSEEYADIFAVLQHLIDSRQAFLNGDWPFINTLLGLKNHAAIHPCPICLVSKTNLLGTARYRKPEDRQSLNPDQPRLITIASDRIVPTPLHLYLGIGNRIILEAYAELLGEPVVLDMLKGARSVHSAGCGGLSDVHQLNGPEITKFIHRYKDEQLLSQIASRTSLAVESRATVSILQQWLKQLSSCLLHARDWTSDELESWRSIVNDIHRHWRRETSINAFPKLHMLHHAVDFAERHRILGRASEAQIESFHASFNHLFHHQHRNQAGNITERLRRSLADSSLRVSAAIPTLGLP
jgi:hypothetical protein